MSYRVVFSPEAEEQLAALYRHVAVAASPMIAAHYTEAIVAYCESMHTFPHRGTRRDDIRPGSRPAPCARIFPGLYSNHR